MDNPSLTEKQMDMLSRVKLHAMESILNNADRVIYHDIQYAQRLIHHIGHIAATENLKTEDLRLLKVSGWFYSCIFSEVSTISKITAEREAEYISFIENTINENLQKMGMGHDDTAAVTEILKRAIKPNEEQTPLSGVLADAVVMDLVTEDTMSRLKKLYEETMLNNANLSITKFYALCGEQFGKYEPKTNYGRGNLQKAIIALLEKVEKENRKLSRKKSILLKKQLEISDEELKELRKNLVSVKGRDVRGVQTLFRTTSRNHYTLNEMVDRKANIMITVNAIILSVVIGGFLGRSSGGSILAILPLAILSLASLFSIIFAVLSITPNRTQGQFTKEEILNKEGNLLYFGNYHNMKFRDYEWGMLEKLNDSDFLYSSMIKDLYYLGKSLHRKYAFIRISLQFFVVGLVSSFIIFMIGRMIAFY